MKGEASSEGPPLHSAGAVLPDFNLEDLPASKPPLIHQPQMCVVQCSRQNGGHCCDFLLPLLPPSPLPLLSPPLLTPPPISPLPLSSYSPSHLPSPPPPHFSLPLLSPPPPLHLSLLPPSPISSPSPSLLPPSPISSPSLLPAPSLSYLLPSFSSPSSSRLSFHQTPCHLTSTACLSSCHFLARVSNFTGISAMGLRVMMDDVLGLSLV